MARSAEETRSNILTAASRIIEEEGVERLTLDAVARQAGVSKGGLLYHYPHKDALVQGMIRAWMDQFIQMLEEAAAQEPEAPGRWARAYIQATLRDMDLPRNFRSGLIAAAATADTSSVMQTVQTYFAEWQALLASDGLDPALATFIRLAADGLWFVDMFGLAAPEDEERAALATRLMALTQTATPASGQAASDTSSNTAS